MQYDVVVVGAGNAAHAAAVSAHENGAERVLMLEKAPEELRGGNTHYSGGLFRFAFERAEDLLPIVPNIEDQVPGFTENIKPYGATQFRADLDRVTEGSSDPELSEALIGRSYDTVRWMVEQGIVMGPATDLSAVKYEGAVRWPQGAVIRAVGIGIGLSRMWFEVARDRGIELRYGTGARSLTLDDSGAISGVVVNDADGLHEIETGAVILGCGGFEANPEWRARYLGRPWDTARVRGTRYNNGDGLRMALEVGALPYGQWSGSHGTPISADAPLYGDRRLTDQTNRLSYPFGVILNTEGDRFIDEGEDFHLLTYAKTGGAVLRQPGGIGYQIFDSKVFEALEPRYRTSDPIVGDTLEELIAQLPLDQETACAHARGVQHRRRRRGHVRPGCPRRAEDGRPGAGEDQLGAAAGLAAVSRLPDHRRHHLHLRRPAHQHGRRGAQHGLDAGSGPLHLRRDGRRPLPLQLPGRLRPDVRRRLRSRRRPLRRRSRERGLARGRGRNRRRLPEWRRRSHGAPIGCPTR